MSEKRLVESSKYGQLTILALSDESSPRDLVKSWDKAQMTLSLWPRDKTSCRALHSFAEALRLTGRFVDAAAVGDYAVVIALEIHDESLISDIQSTIGAIHMNQGDMRKARMAFLDLLATSRRRGDALSTCRSHLWLSYAEKASGRIGVALDHAKESLELALGNELETWATASLRSAGLYAMLLGRFSIATDYLTDALSRANESSTESRIDKARIQLSLALAQALMSPGEITSQLVATARQTSVQEGSRKDVAVSYEYEAVLLLNMGDFIEAETAITEAVRISLEEFPDSDMTSQSYRIWGEIDVKRGDFVLAREHAIDGLGVARRVGERIEIGAIERILGQCDSAEDKDSAASKHFAEAINIHSDCGARYELALSHLAAGQSNCFDRATQLSHLRAALVLFREMEIERFALETEDAIRLLTSPASSMQAISNGTPAIITCSKMIREIVADLDRFKNTSHTILLEGETGVGKDLFARYIHETSNRANLPFVAFNAAAVPEALVESELFGHVRGSFTGAMRDREGLLFAAKDGTFFFNEIGEAPLTFQAKLLTLLETRKSRPVGTNIEKSIGARFIFATNRDLQKDVKAGKFRKDLFFRLCIARVTIPPLRERPEDIDLLLETFLKREGLATSQIQELKGSNEWMSIAHFNWDGNVRELYMFAQRLALEVQHDISVSSTRVLQRLLKSSFGMGAESEVSVERVRISSALKKFDGNKRRAARELDMPESTLRWKIKNLDIHQY